MLASRGEASATAIAEQLAITRQAVAKHLTTLGDVGLVSARRAGREVRYRLRPGPLRLAARWLEGAAGAWDRAADRCEGRTGARDTLTGGRRGADPPAKGAIVHYDPYEFLPWLNARTWTSEWPKYRAQNFANPGQVPPTPIPRS